MYTRTCPYFLYFSHWFWLWFLSSLYSIHSASRALRFSHSTPNSRTESQHLIVWFKNNNTLTTGQEIVADASLYHLDKGMNLVVDQVSEKTKGDYSCTVMPHKVKMDIHLVIGEEPVADNKQIMVSASALLLLSTLVARELSFGILRLDTFF